MVAEASARSALGGRPIACGWTCPGRGYSRPGYSMNMSGAHGAAGHPFISAFKSIRWLTKLLALIAVIPALLVLIIYLATRATALEIWGFSWLVEMAVFVQCLVRASLGPSLRWLTASVLLVTTWNVFSAFAHQRSWPPGQLHSLSLVGYGVALAAAALLAVALVIDIRSGRFGWRRPPAAQE
jgi:hypothetical protein